MKTHKRFICMMMRAMLAAAIGMRMLAAHWLINANLANRPLLSGGNRAA